MLNNLVRVFGFIIFMIAISYISWVGFSYLFEKNYEKIEVYCTVDDKDTRTVLVNNIIVTNYTLDLHVTDNEELKDTITIKQSIWSELEKGSEVKCSMIYKDDKFVGLEIEN